MFKHARTWGRSIQRITAKFDFFLKTFMYEGNLENTLYDMITPLCVAKKLSTNTFLEADIQRLLDGLIFVEEILGVYKRRMLEMSSCLYTGGNFIHV